MQTYLEVQSFLFPPINPVDQVHEKQKVMETLLEFFIRVPLEVLFTKIRIDQEMVWNGGIDHNVDLGSRLNSPLITGQGIDPTSMRLSLLVNLIRRIGNAISRYGIATFHSVH